MGETAERPARPNTPLCPVNSFNEWDPLEEVIVGRLEGATIPGPRHSHVHHSTHGGEVLPLG